MKIQVSIFNHWLAVKKSKPDERKMVKLDRNVSLIVRQAVAENNVLHIKKLFYQIMDFFFL